MFNPLRNSFVILLQIASPFLKKFNFNNFPRLVQSFSQVLNLKEIQQPLSPDQQRRQAVLFFPLRVEHVVKELLPELDLPPALEGALHHPPVLHGSHLDILSEQQAVRCTCNAKVIQMVFPCSSSSSVLPSLLLAVRFRSIC